MGSFPWKEGKVVADIQATNERQPGGADLVEIGGLQQRYGLDPVWVMPEGTTSGQILRRLRELADPVLARGWNLSPRLHTLLWDEVRGR